MIPTGYGGQTNPQHKVGPYYHTKVAPCPFCKCNQAMCWHIGHYDKPWVVECCRCQAQGPHADTEEDAFALWNKRSVE